MQAGKLYEWHKFNTVHAKGGAIRPSLLRSSLSLSLSFECAMHTLFSPRNASSLNVKLNNLSHDLTDSASQPTMIYAESEETLANLNLFDRINEVRLTGDK